MNTEHNNDIKPSSSRRKIILILALLLASIIPIYFIWSLQGDKELALNEEADIKPDPSKNKKANKKPAFLYGLPTDSFEISKSKVKKGESLGKILGENGISASQIHKVVEASKDVFNVRYWQADKNYSLFYSKDSTRSLQYLVYEKSVYDYVFFSLGDSIFVTEGQKKISTVEKVATGTIDYSLSQTIESEKLSPLLAHSIEDVYAWTINFFRLQKGDHFKVVYEDKYIDDSIYAGPGRILAAVFDALEIHSGLLKTCPAYAIASTISPFQSVRILSSR